MPSDSGVFHFGGELRIDADGPTERGHPDRPGMRAGMLAVRISTKTDRQDDNSPQE
jgi:hypothetical protein